jgi:hypothetical protein
MGGLLPLIKKEREVINLDKIKNGYRLVELIGVEEDNDQVILTFEEYGKQKMKKGTFNFMEIQKRDFGLLNPQGEINFYYSRNENIERIIYNIKQYEIERERWRDRHGDAYVRKSKLKEIDKLLEDFKGNNKDKLE